MKQLMHFTPRKPAIHHFRPSTIMIWYPSLVLHSPHFGLLVVEASNSNATASNSGMRLPLVFQPNEPPARSQDLEVKRDIK